MGRSRLSRAGFVVVVVTLLAALFPAAATGQQQGRRWPQRVITKSQRAIEKLHPRLRAEYRSGTTKDVRVFAVVLGDVRAVTALLDDAHVARAPRGAALVVGRVGAQTLPKLASVASVVSVAPVDFRQTGRPLASDPELLERPDADELRARLDKLRDGELTYEEARREARSQPQQDDPTERNLVLDARTHGFAEAWRLGYAGQGTTVAVLDSGTDFGHPDLEGTWAVGPNGWPFAFDPYGTLIWLSDPSLVDLGLSFYTRTEERDVSGQSGATATIRFDTRKGPARNFSAPDETVRHTYRFPRAWSTSGRVRIGMHPDEWLMLAYEERPAVLVTDPNRAGVYDTVYADLDNDYDFSDEKPVSKASPASYRDLNGDGVQDLSGGLLYYISNGTGRNGDPVPGGLEAFGVEIKGEPGELLAWSGDYDPAIGGHGTLTASNVAGQGRINGLAPRFRDLPGDGRYEGAVVGGAPKTKLVPFGDIYFAFEFSTQFAYFLTNAYGVNVTTNSYGSSNVDNDGWDAESQEADIWHTVFGGRTTAMHSTGNGGPGFGTETPPSPYTGIAVGASTQFGGTGWDSIVRTNQIVDDDIITFSNRGPGANGRVGVDVVADGGYSSGDIPLNLVGDGNFAWETWGGTSRSAPVAGAAAALIYQAYQDGQGAIPEGFQHRAREILKSTAQDLGYTSWTQGSGSVEAGDAVRAARSNQGIVSPDEWRVGDYRGQEYPVMAHLMAPGESDSQRFQISGGGTWSVSDRALHLQDAQEMSFTSSPVSQESEYNFNAPDYLIDVSDLVAQHPDADLMVVRAIYPHEQLDPNGDYSADQTWRFLAYNWTDINGDGNLWEDADGDGAVDKVSLETSSNIDGFPDIDYSRSEIDRGEYVRFMYNNADHNTLQVSVRDPNKRTADGIFLGLQHDFRSPDIRQTDFRFRVEFYENRNWQWLSTPETASGSVTATMRVPRAAPYGMYDGALVLRREGARAVVPVAVAVAAETPQNRAGEVTGNLSFGGQEVAERQSISQYNNGAMFGANDLGWRAESGDWRFFFFDVPRRPAEGSLFLVNNRWQDEAPHTDIDTLVFGRSENEYQLADPGPVGAPYIIDTVGQSENTNVGAGVWTFDTATGGPEEWVAAPAQDGLHAVVHHEVDWEGDKFYVPFETTVGGARVQPSQVELTTSDNSGSFDVTFESTMDLPGLSAEAFGLSQPQVTTETARQDDPNDPSSASVKKDVTIDHAARAIFETRLEGHDIDLFVVYDSNGDGQFTNDEIVASSATPTGNERIELVRPPDGQYQVWVQGWAVNGTPEFELTIFPIQGTDMTVTGVPEGPIPAGTPVTLTVEFEREMNPGEDYFGELQMGPSVAPTAISVPVVIHRQ